MADQTASDQTATETAPEESRNTVGSTRELVSRYNHCNHCGANLHFKHQTDFSRNLTEETAQCPECGVKAHSVVHRLQ